MGGVIMEDLGHADLTGVELGLEDLTGGELQDAVDALGKVESHGIDFIPDEHRKSKPSNIVWILLGANLTLGLIVLGWLPVSFGLSWWASFWSIIVGCALGAVLFAPMALIGPRTGTNGPVSSGAVYGVVGRMIGSCLAVFIAIGFYALAVWTGGQMAVYGAHRLWGLADGNLELGFSYAIIAVIAITAAIYGHANMVFVEKFLIPTVGLLMIVGYFVFGSHFNVNHPGGHYLLGTFMPTWALSVTIAAAATFGYGPYVNDWTRHISHKRYSDRSVFLATLGGGFFGLAFPLVFGAYTAVAINNPSLSYVGGLVGISPLWYLVPLIFLGIVGSLGQSTVCIYSNGLDFSSIIPRLKRVPATIVLSCIGVLFIFMGTLVWNIENTVSAFVTLFGVLAAPWISIILVGHFMRRGFYDPQALQVFNRREKGGIYWFTRGLNLRACLAWLIASCIGLLFLTSTIYIGPWSNAAGGIDLSWLSATFIGAGIYFLATRIFPEPAAVYGKGISSGTAKAEAPVLDHAPVAEESTQIPQ
jgi:purine-cytosine permease-like protein